MIENLYHKLINIRKENTRIDFSFGRSYSINLACVDEALFVDHNYNIVLESYFNTRHFFNSTMSPPINLTDVELFRQDILKVELENSVLDRKILSEYNESDFTFGSRFAGFMGAFCSNSTFHVLPIIELTGEDADTIASLEGLFS